MLINHKEIETKWKKEWYDKQIYKTREDQVKQKYYILDMFPYPSGVGLHVGHPKGYIATDIFARMKTMQGFNVLHPMGWDAFGLPAENYAIKNKLYPKIAVDRNIKVFKEQLDKFGFMYDWDREINTTDPEFYKWTQWVFLEMFKRGLAYESFEPINWCPSCKTGLANEDLENGRCERCDSEIEKKPMRQWVLKITAYADRLLDDLEKLPDWEKSIKEMQKSWIGRSEGAIVKFKIQNSKLNNIAEDYLEVFTTRPDTLFGCAYMVVAPEHKLIQEAKAKILNYAEVAAYIEQAQKKSDLERAELQKDKTGVELQGLKAINPVNNEEIPIFVADYVLGGYGTGAIMAVPAHDERDYTFARKYGLPIKQVVEENQDDYQKTYKLLAEADKLYKLAKSDNIACVFWGSLAYAASLGFVYRACGDIDLILEKKEDLASMEKILISLGYAAIAEKDFNGHKVRNYRNDRGVEIDIGTHHEDFLKELGGAGFSVEMKKIADLEIPVAPFKALLNFKQRQAEERKAEKDFIDLEYLHGKIFTEDGISINSGLLGGLMTSAAKQKIISRLEEQSVGKKSVNYKLKDWVFSRQRYWGEPIPIIHCAQCGNVAVPEKDLPVILPEVESYEPTGTGESPLAAIADWVNTVCPQCGGPAKRETNTMPQWAGSSWYYLRYMDPRNDTALVAKDKEKYWSPVDFYVGGAEHATRHLIYARFWHKFLFDIGAVAYDEPFKRLQHVGLILAEDGKKMSKRWGNVVNPDDVIREYGADAVRVYEMFMGPFSQACAWSTSGLSGAHKFLEKVWKLKDKVSFSAVPAESTLSLEKLLHKTIKKVGEDIEAFKFNTAISQMMVFANEAAAVAGLPQDLYEKFLIILAPFAPFMTEELWNGTGNDFSIHQAAWPDYDKDKIKDDIIDLSVQVNGKFRGTVVIPFDGDEEAAVASVKESDIWKKYLAGGYQKIILVRNKIINFIV
jgi:leucyl-tRNA synthetase